MAEAKDRDKHVTYDLAEDGAAPGSAASAAAATSLGFNVYKLEYKLVILVVTYASCATLVSLVLAYSLLFYIVVEVSC